MTVLTPHMRRAKLVAVMETERRTGPRLVSPVGRTDVEDMAKKG